MGMILGVLAHTFRVLECRNVSFFLRLILSVLIS